MFSKTGIHIGVYNNLTALLRLQQMVNHMQYRYIPLRELMNRVIFSNSKHTERNP